MLRLNKLSAVTMALMVALAACSDSTGPNEPFDPEASAADLTVVQGAFSAAAFESLSFVLVPDTGAVPAPLLQASLAAAAAGSRWEAAAAAEAFAAAGPASGPLFPDEILGRTYDRVNDEYQHDAARTDAPTNGVRFVLYGVDPITHNLLDAVIGHVDLLDESTTLAYVARIVAVTDGVERINYTVRAVVGLQTVGLTVAGFITDGSDVIDVDLSVTFVQDGSVSSATADYNLSIPARDFELDAIVVFEIDEVTRDGSIDVEVSFMEGHHAVSVAGVISFNDGEPAAWGGTFEVHVDGQLFAKITVDGDTVTAQNADGGQLTGAEAEAVRDIFDGLDDLFEKRFEDFIQPVAWMFGHE